MLFTTVVWSYEHQFISLSGSDINTFASITKQLKTFEDKVIYLIMHECITQSSRHLVYVKNALLHDKQHYVCSKGIVEFGTEVTNGWRCSAAGDNRRSWIRLFTGYSLEDVPIGFSSSYLPTGSRKMRTLPITLVKVCDTSLITFFNMRLLQITSRRMSVRKFVGKVRRVTYCEKKNKPPTTKFVLIFKHFRNKYRCNQFNTKTLRLSSNKRDVAYVLSHHFSSAALRPSTPRQTSSLLLINY